MVASRMPVINYRRLNSGYVHSATGMFLRLMDVSRAEEDCFAANAYLITIDIMPVTDFDHCSRRFGAVATNLSTGRELWFTEGDSHLLYARRAVCRIDVSG